jgi:hypothetical protein
MVQNEMDRLNDIAERAAETGALPTTDVVSVRLAS